MGTIRATLCHTFDKLPGHAFASPAAHAVILWEMDFTLPVTRQPTTIRGATHLTFDADGKVTLLSHYRDAAENAMPACRC